MKSDFEIQDELPVDLLSPSSISVLLTCPEKFRRSYVAGDRVWIKSGAWGVSGTAFHEGRRFTLTSLMDDGVIPPEEKLREEYDRAFDKAATENTLALADVDKSRHAGWSMLQTYTRKIAPKLPHPIAVERGARLHVPGIPIVVYGRIDAEFETKILDTKTGTQAPKKPKPEWLVAGLIYMAMVEKPIEWHTIGFTKAGNVSYQIPSPTAPLELAYRPSRMDAAYLLIGEAYEQLLWLMRSHGPDRPWPGAGLATGACVYCQFKQVCPFYVN